MSKFLLHIFLVMLFLCLAVGWIVPRLGLPAPRMGMGLAIVAVMGLNALGAVLPLYGFRHRNPFNLYIGGMLVRLALLGAAFALALNALRPDRSSAIAIALTGMVSFLAYQAVEIAHFLRHGQRLLSRT